MGTGKGRERGDFFIFFYFAGSERFFDEKSKNSKKNLKNISQKYPKKRTSILITANIASSLPTSVGAALTQAADKGAAAKTAAASAAAAAAASGAVGTETASSSTAAAAVDAAAALASADKLSLALYGLSFLATTLGVVYVQEAERKIPINYASRYRAPGGRAGASGTGAAGPGGLARSSYLPFKVNATGVMPVIFASTLLALPTGLVRYAPALEPVATALGPTGPLYLPVSVFFFLPSRRDTPRPLTIKKKTRLRI